MHVSSPPATVQRKPFETLCESTLTNTISGSPCNFKIELIRWHLWTLISDRLIYCFLRDFDFWVTYSCKFSLSRYVNETLPHCLKMIEPSFHLLWCLLCWSLRHWGLTILTFDLRPSAFRRLWRHVTSRPCKLRHISSTSIMQYHDLDV